MRRRSEYRKASGFSLVELLVVAAILMSIAALSAPTMWNVISSARSRSAIGDIAGLIQDSRSTAVKHNRMKSIHFTETSGRTWVTSTSTIATDSTKPDRTLVLPPGMAMMTSPSGTDAPSTLLDAETMWGGGTDPVTTEASFNPRGMPCSYSVDTKKCESVGGFVYYFSLNGRWSAIGISPAGRIRAFYWNGSEWGK